MACTGAADARCGEQRSAQRFKVEQPPRALAARAVDVQFKAVAGDVADGLEWQRAKHGENLTAAASREFLCQQ